MIPAPARLRALSAGAVVLLAAGCMPYEPPGPTPPPVVEPAPGASGMPSSGSVAIAPLPNAPITAAQVRDYVLSHRVPGALRATNMAILSTNFVTHQQLRTLLHSARLGIPDQEQVCLVVMSGTFAFGGPPGQTPTFPFAIEVFDARTGNLLQYGGRPRAPQL
jgi:hypothetical protein